MGQIEGLRLTGEFVYKLVDKNFTIMKMIQKKVRDFSGDGDIDKYVMTVKLSDGKIRDWIPNMTVIQTLADRFGDNSDNFLGKKAKFKVVEQKVRGNLTKVIYVE